MLPCEDCGYVLKKDDFWRGMIDNPIYTIDQRRPGMSKTLSDASGAESLTWEPAHDEIGPWRRDQSLHVVMDRGAGKRTVLHEVSEYMLSGWLFLAIDHGIDAEVVQGHGQTANASEEVDRLHWLDLPSPSKKTLIVSRIFLFLAMTLDIVEVLKILIDKLGKVGVQRLRLDIVCAIKHRRMFPGTNKL